MARALLGFTMSVSRRKLEVLRKSETHRLLRRSQVSISNPLLPTSSQKQVLHFIVVSHPLPPAPSVSQILYLVDVHLSSMRPLSLPKLDRPSLPHSYNLPSLHLSQLLQSRLRDLSFLLVQSVMPLLYEEQLHRRSSRARVSHPHQCRPWLHPLPCLN